MTLYQIEFHMNLHNWAIIGLKMKIFLQIIESSYTQYTQQTRITPVTELITHRKVKNLGTVWIVHANL